MKKLFLVLLAVLFSIFIAHAVMADPWATADPIEGINGYKVTGATWAAPEALPNGQFALNLAPSPVGPNTFDIAPCIVDPNWGEMCSTAVVTYSFTRPAAPTASVKNLRIQKAKPTSP